MKVALVSPHFPPARCGVGDYTARLASELASQGHPVFVWTSGRSPDPFTGVATRSFPGPWRSSTLKAMAEDIVAWEPDATVVQYTPQLYARKFPGTNLALPSWIRRLRERTRRPVALSAHELHYPIAGLGPDRLLLGWPQFMLFQSLIHAASHVFFTYEVPFRRYSRLAPWLRKRLAWLPVGSNIPVSAGDPKDFLGKAAIPQQYRVLLQFGGTHSTRLFGHTLLALDRARLASQEEILLALVGVSDEELDPILKRHDRPELRARIRALGYLTEEQASYCIRRADLVLAPYLDGISTRRGSVMAALAHGKAVLTTSGYHTDSSVPWHRITRMVPARHAEAFATFAIELLNDRGQAALLGKAAQTFYEAEFSWKVIASRLIERLANLSFPS